LLKKVKKHILISIAAAGLLYLGFTIYADFNSVASAFKTFNWFLIPVLLSLSFLNYLTRYLKWDYYLSIINVKISKLDSFSIFMSGLIMSVTPGKMGELLKAYLVKQIAGYPVSKTAPVIFAERITDFISLILIAIVGAYSFDYGRGLVIGTGIFFLLVVVLISNKKIALSIIKSFERNKFFKKHLASIHSAYESSYQMLRPMPLLKMTGLSFVSWFFECFGYYLILINFGIGVDLLWSAFVYAFATIAGAITMLPGGLGVTEGSLTLLIIQAGHPDEVAVASTFIIRAATLWFAVLVGIISVSFYQKRFGQISDETISNQLQE
jgi:glycosyltransferase 2 family protein